MENELLLYLGQQRATTPNTVQPAPVNTAKEKPEGANSFLVPVFMFAVVFIGMYILVIRPQKKEEKRKKEMMNALNKGDSVVTSSGILGTVSSVKEETVILKVGDGTRMEFLRSSISGIHDKNKGKAAKKN